MGMRVDNVGGWVTSFPRCMGMRVDKEGEGGSLHVPLERLHAHLTVKYKAHLCGLSGHEQHRLVFLANSESHLH